MMYNIIERMQYAYEHRTDIIGELHIPQNAVGEVARLRKRYIQMTAKTGQHINQKE